MNNQSNYSRVKNQPGTQGNHATKEHEGSFPVHCLPELLKNTAERVNLFTGMPIELIVSVLMTTLSIISQYLVRIISPYTGASGPCSLYLLTLAESGEGKTFLSRLFMKPVHQQLEKMKHEYNRQLARYKNEHLIWKTGLQGLNANLRQAIKKGYGVEDVQIQLEKHYKSEPGRPVVSIVSLCITTDLPVKLTLSALMVMFTSLFILRHPQPGNTFSLLLLSGLNSCTFQLYRPRCRLRHACRPCRSGSNC